MQENNEGNEKFMIFTLRNGRVTFRERRLKDLLLNNGIEVRGENEYYIHPIEALYLMNEKGAKVRDCDRELSPDEISRIFKIDERVYAVYSDLRKRGYLLDSSLFIKKMGMGVKLLSPRDIVDSSSLENFIAAIVDDNLECTYFIVKEENIKGEFGGFDDYFIGGKRDFSDFEKAMLHRDLVERGCRVKSGLKFGTEFIAYVEKGETHSKYMVKILRSGMEWIEVAGLARVANGVKKTLILAVPEESFRYYSITWFRA